MRWGIFWRTVQFNLKKSAHIIKVAALFIVEKRIGCSEDKAYFQNFDIAQNDPVQRELSRATGEIARAIVISDNNAPRPVGRRSLDDVELAAVGLSLCRQLVTKLSVADLTRPTHSDMHYNSHGHIYMTS